MAWDWDKFLRYLATPLGMGAWAESASLDGTPTKSTGAFADIANFFGAKTDISNTELGNWFKQNYSGTASDFINTLDDATLGSLLDQYYTSKDMFGYNQESFDYGAAVQELEKMINSVNGMSKPVAPDYQKIYNEAQEAIDAENQGLYALLDSNLARQTANYQDELGNLNQMYNDYTRQILSNDYIKNQQLMGSVGSALSKSKQSALEAGASAGARLAGNINTILGVQNKQTQQSLETSNQLAQAMLNQRQAAAGIRGNYNQMLNSDTQSRIGIQQGSTERKNNYAAQQFGTQQQIYDNQMSNYEGAMANHSSNPFYGSYQSYRQNKTYKNNQGY
jgi:hypothetical protein